MQHIRCDETVAVLLVFGKNLQFPPRLTQKYHTSESVACSMVNR
jgi:hypothetical protein